MSRIGNYTPDFGKTKTETVKKLEQTKKEIKDPNLIKIINDKIKKIEGGKIVK